MEIEKFLDLKAQFAEDMKTLSALKKALESANNIPTLYAQLESVINSFSEARTRYYENSGITFDLQTIGALFGVQWL